LAKPGKAQRHKKTRLPAPTIMRWRRF